MTAYYNEIDPFAAHVLRHLIATGVVAHGVVDTRSIKEVTSDDLKGFTQCHFFAGGGFWSVAARLAGWPDERPLWTGSCPCQPFSVAGKGGGADDPRHLWPDFHRLIRAARPAVVVGEQVAGAAGYGWFDGIAADLEREDYACRAVDFPACAVDAPHIRNRQYWCALADSSGAPGQQDPGSPLSDEAAHGRAGRVARQQDSDNGLGCDDEGPRPGTLEHSASLGWGEGRAEPELRGGRATAASADAQEPLGYSVGAGLEGYSGHGDRAPGWWEPAGPVAPADGSDVLHADCNGPWELQRSGRGEGVQPLGGRRDLHAIGRNGSFWSGAEWIVCHDGKARRAEPGIRLLVDGFHSRVDLWRIAGNAIVPQAAAEVLAALMDVLPAWSPFDPFCREARSPA